jgi:hypothetical protein
MIIRKLGPGDVAAMCALNVVFAVAFEDDETYRSAPPDEAWLARLLGSDNFIALAAVAQRAGQSRRARSAMAQIRRSVHRLRLGHELQILEGSPLP